MVQTLERILATIPFYTLSVNMDDDAALIAYHTMKID
jgi:hypothetical protein